MPKPIWHSQIATLSLAELRSKSLTDIAALEKAFQSAFAMAHEAALRRAKTNKIDLLRPGISSIALQ